MLLTIVCWTCVWLQTFFNNIWVALVDNKVQIRESAAKTLSSCLNLVAQRASRNRGQWYK